VTPWDSANAAIVAAFVDPERIAYTRAGATLPPVPAVRSEYAAPRFEGPGQTLLRITYEIQASDMPTRPANGEHFTHRGRRWRVTQVGDVEAGPAWLVTVVDAGAAL
jgi:hypothetical protein